MSNTDQDNTDNTPTQPTAEATTPAPGNVAGATPPAGQKIDIDLEEVTSEVFKLFGLKGDGADGASGFGMIGDLFKDLDSGSGFLGLFGRIFGFDLEGLINGTHGNNAANPNQHFENLARGLIKEIDPAKKPDVFREELYNAFEAGVLEDVASDEITFDNPQEQAQFLAEVKVVIDQTPVGDGSAPLWNKAAQKISAISSEKYGYDYHQRIGSEANASATTPDVLKQIPSEFTQSPQIDVTLPAGDYMTYGFDGTLLTENQEVYIDNDSTVGLHAVHDETGSMQALGVETSAGDNFIIGVTENPFDIASIDSTAAATLNTPAVDIQPVPSPTMQPVAPTQPNHALNQTLNMNMGGL